jgi:hypothetical protein
MKALSSNVRMNFVKKFSFLSLLVATLAIDQALPACRRVSEAEENAKKVWPLLPEPP